MLSKLKRIFVYGRKIQKVVDEGQDVFEAVDTIQRKYADLPDDVKGAWIEVQQFVDSLRDLR